MGYSEMRFFWKFFIMKTILIREFYLFIEKY